MELTGDAVVVRPVPNDVDRRHLDRYARTGKRRKGMVSPSWWEHGALVADDDGPGLIDADGVRHALPPLPPGAVVLDSTGQSATGLRPNYLFVVSGPGPDGVGLLDISGSFGFGYEGGLGRWAERLGLRLSFEVGGEYQTVYRCRARLPYIWQQDAAQRAWEEARARRWWHRRRPSPPNDLGGVGR